jgi:hypothetical protein
MEHIILNNANLTQTDFSKSNLKQCIANGANFMNAKAEGWLYLTNEITFELSIVKKYFILFSFSLSHFPCLSLIRCII